MTQDWSFGAGAAPAPVRLKGRGLTITGVVLLVSSLLVGVVGVVGLVRSAGDLVEGFGSSFLTPGSVVRTLDAGSTYTVYQLDEGNAPQVQLADITITGPTGFSVPVAPVGVDSQFTSSSDTFVAVAEFDTPTSGAYTIVVATEGATVLVAPGLQSLASAGLWFLVIGLAVLLGVIGLVLLIIGLVQRSSSRKAMQRGTASYGPGYGGATYDAQQAGVQPYAGPAQVYEQPQQPAPAHAPAQSPPAGWYPDPARQAGQRYWDGQQWTEHTA